MKQELDAYAHLESAIHQWEPRLKLIGLLTLIFAFAFVQALWLTIPMLVVTAALYQLSRLPWPYLGARLRVPGLFIGFLVISLPFLSGETAVWRWGWLAVYQEGLLSALLIVARFVSIITLSLILFGTETIATNLKAMRALRVPDIFVDMLLLTYRYIFEIGYMFSTTRTAVRLRGYGGVRANRESLSVLASLLGNLFVRSYEQAERVYKAMILRGYGYGSPNADEFTATAADRMYLVMAVTVAMAFVIGQWLTIFYA